MKRGKKINNFRPETHFLFTEDNYWKCWGRKCGGKNHANCGHHIFGRGRSEGCEKSPLNYAPLNNFECHLADHGWLMTQEGKKMMFQKTLDFLSSRGYTLTEEDHAFLDKYGVEIYHLGIRL